MKKAKERIKRRVTVSFDPMPALRQAASEAVNERYNGLAAKNSHRDAAHAHKRMVAAAVIAGSEAPAEFAAEAALRKVTPLELAQGIAARPNEAAQRELARQTELIAIDAAASPDALRAAMEG